MGSEHIKKIEAFIKFLSKQPQGALYQEKQQNKDEQPENKKLSKKERLNQLKVTFGACQACPLATQGRAQVVFGVGDPDARLMFVGEGPGRDEDREGAPFVGRAGKLLTKIIEAMGLTRDQVYISNTVKCRPPNNRTPLPEESETCINSILSHELAIVQPTVVCTLGATATRALLGEETKISQVRGTFVSIGNFQVIPTYHPAYLLRNPSAKRFVWDDMQKIIAHLGQKNNTNKM